MSAALAQRQAFSGCKVGGASRTSRRSVAVRAQINPDIKKQEPKVVDTLKISELPKKFPLCNGSHVKYNKETGDNVGPVIIEKDQ